MSETLLDRLLVRLTEALAYNANAHVAPVALLWPDASSQWGTVVDRIKERVPVIGLGDYDPDMKQGPAYWLRCVLMGTVDAGLPDGLPVVYLPGITRNELRAVETCPPELAPIAELQYRSQWFSHPNGKDWSVRSFLIHKERGLGLQVTDDVETNSVMLHALDRVLDLPMDRLTKQLLDADFFSDLINPDPVRSLLSWLDDPAGFRRRFDAAQWSAFLQQCKADYDFDPTTEGAITGAENLSQRKGAWAEVWKRFAETPERYPGIPERLRQAKPMEFSFERSETWPQDNETAEDELRAELLTLSDETAVSARATILKLEEAHGHRRGWVWADLGLAPLAFAIEHLAHLAELTTKPVDGDDVSALVAAYTEHGWRADDALVRALQSVTTQPDRDAVGVAGAALYRPWLEVGAKALQGAIGPMANALTYHPAPPPSTKKGVVTLFVDGLRLDLAHQIHDRLTSIGLDVTISASLSALPTVTQTTKPALVPVKAGALTAGPDLHPANAKTGTKATITVLRALMVENGVQILGVNEYGDPTGVAWTEAGEVDRRGHETGLRLVDYVNEELERVVSRVRELLDSGWEQIDVLTDHGWILLPGGMEKVDLPVATTETKKGRCARLKDGASVAVPTVPWFWDKDVRIALAPGVTCFEANKEYEHGGVSPQECIVPRLTVTPGTAIKATGGPEITQIKWLRLLCRIEFEGVSGNVTVDLRGLPADPKTSIAEEAKETGGAGKVSLMVPDEEHEGERAHVVLVADDGDILAQREVIVGRNR